MMAAVTAVQLILWELVIPVLVGTLFFNVFHFQRNLPFWWVSGQMLLWAVFQLVCVPMTLCQIDFWYLAWTYEALTALLFLAAAVFFVRRKGWRTLHLTGLMSGHQPRQTLSKKTAFLWGIFGILLLFQLIQAVRLVYGDGDDAYYVALTTITSNSQTMYRQLPYTGGTTDLDVRHGLAPFPVWIAFLADICRLAPSTTAHIAVPVMLIAMTYAIFYLLGERIFRDKPERIPLFLVFLELLVLFGDYSFYTAENFMIARSRQGKAALGNLIVPFLFVLLFLLFEWLEENKNIPIKYWVLLGAVMTTACLCTTMGALLGCMLVGTAGLCGTVAFRKWKVLLPLAACCAPCGVFAVLYLLH